MDEHDVPTGWDTTHAIGSRANRSEENGEFHTTTEKNVQSVKDFFAAIGTGDREGFLALAAEDIEWIIPGEVAAGRNASRTRGIGGHYRP